MIHLVQTLSSKSSDRNAPRVEILPLSRPDALRRSFLIFTATTPLAQSLGVRLFIDPFGSAARDGPVVCPLYMLGDVRDRNLT